MTDTLGRLIRRPAAGSVSTSNLFAALRALGSGSAQIELTSDLNWLGEQSAYRTLASIPGFEDVSRASPTNATGTDLAPSDFDWYGPLVTPLGGGAMAANACLGTHAVHRLAGTGSLWPRAVLRARVEPPSSVGEYVYAILVAMPGRGAAVGAGGLYKSERVEGGAGWGDLEISIVLTEAIVAPLSEAVTLGDGGSSGVSPFGESVNFGATTFWVSFFSGTGGKCQAVAITLGLEPPL